MPYAQYGPESAMRPAASFARSGRRLLSPLGHLYLADGTGHERDERVLQQAVDDVAYGGGGGIGVVGGAIYKLAATVVVPARVELFALGASATFVRDPSFGGPLFRVAAGATDVRLAGLTFDGTDADGLDGDGPLVELDAGSCAVTFERLTFTHVIGSDWTKASDACDPVLIEGGGGGGGGGGDALAIHEDSSPIHHHAGSITDTALASNAVTTAKLKDANVTDMKLGNRTITDTTAAVNVGQLQGLLGGLANVIRGLKGTATWRDLPPTTLAAAKTHIVDSPLEHGAQARVDAHAGLQGAHGTYWGLGVPAAIIPTLAVGPGTLYRDTQNGHLWEAVASLGWQRVGGMTIRGIYRGTIPLTNTADTNTGFVPGVNFGLMEARYLGISSAARTDSGSHEVQPAAVLLELLNATTIRATRQEHTDNANTVTVSYEVTEWQA